MRIRKLFFLMPLLLVTLASSGCLFSPDNDPSPPPPVAELPFPGTEDLLMANFKTAYSSMNIDDYRQVLDPSYVFMLRTEDVLPGESDRITYAEELAVAEHMFSGQPIPRPGDTTVPALQSIQIAVLDRVGTWTDMGASDPNFPNSRKGLFNISLSFARSGDTTIIVSGQQEFYVRSEKVMVDGVEKDRWALCGQWDLSTVN